MSSPQVTAIVSAKDEASAVLKAVAKLAAETARNIDKMGAGPNYLARNMNAATVAAERHLSVLQRMQGLYHTIGGAASRLVTNVAPFAGPAILAATKRATAQGADMQSEIVKLENAGVGESERKSAVAQSAQLASQFTNVHRSAILETYKELRSILLDVKEVPKLLPDVINARAVLDAQDKSGHSSAGLQFLVKGAEVLGLAQDPERFRNYIDAAVKGLSVAGKTINPENIFEFAKYSKSSGIALSDRFKMTTAMSLSQELGGSTAGQSVDQFVKQIVGGFQGQNHAAAKEFVALGLAKKDDFLTNKAGDIKGMKTGHKVAGADLALSDPDKWVNQYLLPALQSKGYADDESIIAEVRRLFPAGRAADLVSKLITQRESYENHARLFENAPGLKGWDALSKDFNAQADAFKVTLENLAATLTNPIMTRASTTLKGVTDSLGDWGKSIADWEAKHPNKGAAIAGAGIAGGLGVGGYLTYLLGTKLFSGFGLGTSATALTGSAAALDVSAASLEAAAASLGGAAAASKAAEAGKTLSTAATGAATTGAAAAGGVGLLGSAAALGVGAIVAAAAPFAISALKDAGYLKPLEDLNRMINPHDDAKTVFERMRHNVAPGAGPDALERAKAWDESKAFSLPLWAKKLAGGFKPDAEHYVSLRSLEEKKRKGKEGLPAFAQVPILPQTEERKAHIENIRRVAELKKQLASPPVSSSAPVAALQTQPQIERIVPTPTFVGRLAPVEKPVPLPTFTKFDATSLSKDFGKIDVHSDVAVQGTVSGEATLMQSIRVDASPQLLATVESAKTATHIALSGELQRNKTGATMAGSNAAKKSTGPLGLGLGGFKATSTGY